MKSKDHPSSFVYAHCIYYQTVLEIKTEALLNRNTHIPLAIRTTMSTQTMWPPENSTVHSRKRMRVKKTKSWNYYGKSFDHTDALKGPQRCPGVSSRQRENHCSRAFILLGVNSLNLPLPGALHNPLQLPALEATLHLPHLPPGLQDSGQLEGVVWQVPACLYHDHPDPLPQRSFSADKQLGRPALTMFVYKRLLPGEHKIPFRQGF